MIGLLFVGLVGTFLYWIWDNGYDLPGISVDGREAAAQVRQEKEQVDRGAFLYARNCRSCHGFTGGGGLERTGLPGAVLNNPANRPPELTAAETPPKILRFTDTIHCGRIGTLMPAWSLAQGGPLNDFQILQLVTLITSQYAEEGWQDAVEYANEADAFSPGKELVEAVGVDDDEIVVNDVAGVLIDEDDSNDVPDAVIRIGGDTVDEPYELLNVIAVDEETNTLTVERGAAGSEAIEHEAESEVYQGPILPPDGPITGEGPGDAPCGQANFTGPSGGEEAALADGDTIEAQDNVFVFDGSNNPVFTAPAGATITVTDAGTNPHNLRVDGPDGEYMTDDDIVTDPEILAAGEEGEITLDLAPGTYNYQCEIHPELMTGEITIE